MRELEYHFTNPTFLDMLTCQVCGKEKLEDDFYKTNHSTCKRCLSARYKKYRAKVLPEVDQQKILRVFQILNYMMQSPRTVNEMSLRFGVTTRTVYRYINLLESLGTGIDEDFHGRYFIPKDYCPLCGREHKTNNHYEGRINLEG